MFADMAELADALDLGSSVNRRAGSTPVIRIFFQADALFVCQLFLFGKYQIVVYNKKNMSGKEANMAEYVFEFKCCRLLWYWCRS